MLAVYWPRGDPNRGVELQTGSPTERAGARPWRDYITSAASPGGAPGALHQTLVTRRDCGGWRRPRRNPSRRKKSFDFR
ncbi:hypothetical protein EVAR_13016_1 [Eumeta japonica]|uniref:Uncharacterized protein n=1 Tax=Eumeta variegata TaxID=151549 RepID=A0A4C1TWX8_EUMVA|nr:hypothetical protein EVAR_13016_1 [Eumeta japonica]